jgi:hypothetical protein
MRIILAVLFLMISTTAANAQNLPRPLLQFQKVEQYSAGGKDWVRYRFEVVNRSEYEAALFAASPNLPPCGANINSARTWVDFYTPGAGATPGKRLYGYCALGTSENLGQLWFAVEAGQEPPRWVYVEFTDRLRNQKVRSNLALVP